MAVLLILALYAVVIVTFSIISFFIIYHLTHYTVDSEFKIVMLVFFVVVSSGLFLSNLALFFSLNWNEIVVKLLSSNL
jgi:hypothetical protein